MKLSIMFINIFELLHSEGKTRISTAVAIPEGAPERSNENTFHELTLGNKKLIDKLVIRMGLD